MTIILKRQKHLYHLLKWSEGKNKEHSIAFIKTLHKHLIVSAFVTPFLPLSYPHIKTTPSTRHLLECTRGLALLSIFFFLIHRPEDFESFTHTLPGFPTDVPHVITVLQRALMAARGQYEGNVKKLSAAHTLHLPWEASSPFLPVKFYPAFRFQIKAFLLQEDFLHFLHTCSNPNKNNVFPL